MPQIIRVVNWHEYQHYKDRNPPWIKLYTRLIDGDSREFLKLKDEIKWQFLAITMLASRQQNAIVLDEEWLSTRLRLNKPLNLKALEASGLIEIVEIASASLASCKQIAIPETETETEAEERQRQSPKSDPAVQDGFQAWYRVYPKRVGKIKAAAAWGKLSQEDRDLAAAAVASFAATWAARPEADFQFCPHPTSWLNQRRWEDEGAIKPPPPPKTPEEIAKDEERAYWIERKRISDEEDKRERLELIQRMKGGASAGAGV